MINRSTAQSLMSDIWADSYNDNELKKAYFGDHPLHDEAVDTLWGLNWFANGHPQDGFGNPLPLDRLAPDERRTAEDGLKAVYPLRTEIDKRQGVALPWDKIAPEGAANINQARQKYLQTVDPVYSTALHEPNHPAHESVKVHYGAWQDWLSGVPGPAPRWGDLDPINPYDRKAVSPLRNPWSAAALTDPSDTGLLGAGMAAGKRGVAAPAAPATAGPFTPDSGDAAPGPLSPSILKALSHIFAANVAGHLGIDPPRRLAPDDANDGMDDRSLIGGAKADGFKTLEYLPGRDDQPNLTAEPYRPDRDGPAKFLRVGGDGENRETAGDVPLHHSQNDQQIAQAGEVDDSPRDPPKRPFLIGHGLDADVPIENWDDDVLKSLGFDMRMIELIRLVKSANPQNRQELRDRIADHLQAHGLVEYLDAVHGSKASLVWQSMRALADGRDTFGQLQALRRLAHPDEYEAIKDKGGWLVPDDIRDLITAMAVGGAYRRNAKGGPSPYETRKLLQTLKLDRAGIQNLGESAIWHAFKGNITKGGRATGYHYEWDATNKFAPRVEITRPADQKGVYAGKVTMFDAREGRWVQKDAISAFFPKSWTPERVITETEAALTSARAGNSRVGITPSGVRVQFTFLPDGSVREFYPKLD